MKHAIASLFARDGTRPRPSRPRHTPADYGLLYENVTFPSRQSDPLKLSGWLIPAASASSNGIIILCHGLRCARSYMLAKARMLHRHHFTTLLFDFRAHGLSEGQVCTLGLHESGDVEGAVDYLRSRPDTVSLPIGAIGESMGGAALLLAAERCPEIRAVVVEAVFASLEQAVEHHLRLLLGPFGASVLPLCREMAREQYHLPLEAVSPEKAIRALSPRPVMLIQDGLDLTCPRQQSERLFAAACTPKERWLAPAALHCRAFPTYPAEYERRVAGLFRQHLTS